MKILATRTAGFIEALETKLGKKAEKNMMSE